MTIKPPKSLPMATRSMSYNRRHWSKLYITLEECHVIIIEMIQMVVLIQMLISLLGNDPLHWKIKGNCEKKKKKRNKRILSYSKQKRWDIYIQFLRLIHRRCRVGWVGLLPTPKTGVQHWHPAVIPTIWLVWSILKYLFFFFYFFNWFI
jgi:hypothetical protein